MIFAFEMEDVTYLEHGFIFQVLLHLQFCPNAIVSNDRVEVFFFWFL